MAGRGLRSFLEKPRFALRVGGGTVENWPQHGVPTFPAPGCPRRWAVGSPMTATFLVTLPGPSR